jgi:heme/copper-type cytochrome/quinol oxidase subunit 1
MPMLWLGYCGMPRRVLDYPASLCVWPSYIIVKKAKIAKTLNKWPAEDIACQPPSEAG